MLARSTTRAVAIAAASTDFAARGLGNPFVQGQVFYAQGWFRDPGAPKQTNLSDGLRFTLCN